MDVKWIIHNLQFSGLRSSVDSEEDTIFVRGETRRLLNTLNLLDDPTNQKRLLQVDGQPGVGKSTEIFGWALNKVLGNTTGSTQSLLWCHCSGKVIHILKYKNGRAIHGIFDVTATFNLSNILPRELGYDITIIDGVVHANDARDYFHYAGSKNIGKIVISCTAYSAPGLSGSMAQELGSGRLADIFTVDSWEFDEYVDALNAGVNFPCLQGVVKKDRLTVLRQHYYYGGGSIRFMRFQDKNFTNLLDNALDRISNIDSILRGIVAHKSPDANIDMLFQTFGKNGERGT